jgi:hypothetical protein
MRWCRRICHSACNFDAGQIWEPIDIPPYSPELNPKENLWDEIREKIFKNYALKSMDAVCAKLKQAVLYIERNPKLVRSDAGKLPRCPSCAR